MRPIKPKDIKSNNGFTIIEVVLVLAIAGLIFLVVFLALPALQKSQRDNARKQDVAKVIAGLQQYMVDNGNQLPTSSVTVYYSGNQGYFEGLSMASTIALRKSTEGCSWNWVAVTTLIRNVQVSIGCTCSQVVSNTGYIDQSLKYAAVHIKLESNTWYCQDFSI